MHKHSSLQISVKICSLICHPVPSLFCPMSSVNTGVLFFNSLVQELAWYQDRMTWLPRLTVLWFILQQVPFNQEREEGSWILATSINSLVPHFPLLLSMLSDFVRRRPCNHVWEYDGIELMPNGWKRHRLRCIKCLPSLSLYPDYCL